MAEFKFTCPACSGTLKAEDEAALFEKVHEHAHEAHGMHMTAEMFHAMLAEQQAQEE